MYVIAVYDVASERTGKMLKLCRRYLHWIQNSVFEGEITDVKFKELVIEAEKIMDKEYDSFILFKNRDAAWLDKQVIGAEKSSIDQFL
jgi:CRISPR-associated protein Cas2